jgi:hypothetical protein
MSPIRGESIRGATQPDTCLCNRRPSASTGRTRRCDGLQPARGTVPPERRRPLDGSHHRRSPDRVGTRPLHGGGAVQHRWNLRQLPECRRRSCRGGLRLGQLRAVGAAQGDLGSHQCVPAQPEHQARWSGSRIATHRRPAALDPFANCDKCLTPAGIGDSIRPRLRRRATGFRRSTPSA